MEAGGEESNRSHSRVQLFAETTPRDAQLLRKLTRTFAGPHVLDSLSLNLAGISFPLHSRLFSRQGVPVSFQGFTPVTSDLKFVDNWGTHIAQWLLSQRVQLWFALVGRRFGWLGRRDLYRYYRA